MFIPTSISVDIVGKAVLKGKAMVEMLKVVEVKNTLFADSPIGATMQDDGKRKRSDDLLLFTSALVESSYFLS